MSAAPSASTTPLFSSRSSSLDKAPQLVGQLDRNGIAKLKIYTGSPSLQPTTAGPPSMNATLEEPAHDEFGAANMSSESASEEDYDHLEHDPQAVVPGGKGGGFETNDIREVPDDGRLLQDKVSGKQRPTSLRLKSIPIMLKKSNEKGKYFLIADDDEELKEILRVGLERENDPAPPKRRTKFSDLVFTRRFTAFDRQNAEHADSPFHGFFTLFWLGIAIFMIQIALKNWSAHGNVLGTNDIMKLMVRRDLFLLGVSDAVMCGVTGFGWVLQKLVLNGYVNWNRSGWIIQNVWQTFFMISALSWTLYREWPWTHTVFFVLHSLVMLMKQHSYAFYTGYLSETYKTRKSLERKLKQLEQTAPVQTPSATKPTVMSLSTSYLDQRPSSSKLNQRRLSHHASSSQEVNEITRVADAIESGDPLDIDQIDTFKRIVQWEIDAMSEDLKGKSSHISRSYPNNLTLINHYEYIALPTVVYELEYPRSETINWAYVVEKGAATAGVLFIMMLISQTFIYPVVVRTVEMKVTGMPLQQRLEAFPAILSDLIFPFMMEYMMAWVILHLPHPVALILLTATPYLIWECILNLIAELTYFADRGFYADWWNSVSWDQFARDWNRPVHNFLLRHVYHSSISSMRVNKYTATLITFFLSALVHELVMWCLFKKLRGYLLILQMSQIPLVQLSRTRWLKGRATLGNLIFWIGIFTGPSLLCSLYLIL